MADRFEDLDAWKVARELANLIYVLGRESGFSKDYGFKDQIQRAAVSVMNNVAEGFERGSNKDFAKFGFRQVFIYSKRVGWRGAEHVVFGIGSKIYHRGTV